MRVLAHMNNPNSSCHTYYKEMINVGEILCRHRPHPTQTQSQVQNPLDHPTMDDQPLNVGEYPLHDEFGTDDMDTDTPGRTDRFFTECYPGASQTYGAGRTFMDKFDTDQHSKVRLEYLYYPFTSRDEWELAAFLLRSSLSMASIDKFLKLGLVSIIIIIQVKANVFPSP
jgi:hypothetical protein